MREHVSKLTQEKHRLSEQFTERQSEFERQLQRVETEKWRNQEDFQKLLREKEHHLTAKISEILAERQLKV